MRHLIGGLGLIFLLPLFGAEQEAPPPERPPAAKLVLAVLPFLDLATKQEETLGIGSTLATELQERGGLTLVERARLEEILQEQHISLTGITDPRTAAQIGKIANAQQVIIGDVAYDPFTQRRHVNARVAEVETAQLLPGKAHHVRLGPAQDPWYAAEQLAEVLYLKLLNKPLPSGPANFTHPPTAPQPNTELRVAVSFNHPPGENGLPIYYEGDLMRLTVRAEASGYLTVNSIDSEGKVIRLFPVHPGQNAFIRQGTERTLPDAEYERFGYESIGFSVFGGPGVEYIQVLLTSQPVDFTARSKGLNWSAGWGFGTITARPRDFMTKGVGPVLQHLRQQNGHWNGVLVKFYNAGPRPAPPP